jgi:predicted hydrolase (HD superfamily)
MMSAEVPAMGLGREDALKSWKKWNDDEALYRHALAVEAVMRRFAPRYSGDPELWGIVGILHDVDYQKFPKEHCVKARELLEADGWPAEVVRAVQSHGWGLCVDVEPRSDMEKTLYAVDELTGFVYACALVRPSRSVQDLEPKSVLKKWKLPAFASGVNREVVQKGAGLLGIPLEELIGETIMAMRGCEADIGLGACRALDHGDEKKTEE